MFKLYRAKRKLRIKEAELVASQYDAAIQTIDKALEARNVVVDQDALSGWIPLGSDGGVTEEDHRSMLESAYNFYHTNPHARAVIRNLVKFTLGKGPLVIPEADNEKVKEIWDDFKDENNFNIREKEIARRTFRDGEVFLRLFINKNDGTVKIRFIRAGIIRNPNDKNLPENVTHGIMTKVDDIETPLLYYKTNADGTFSEAFKAEEIIHIKIFADSDEKRGISQLRVIARRLKQYEGWLEDRIVLNKIRTAIALIKKYDTSSQKLKQIRDENMSDQLSATKKRQQAFSAGTVIHSSKGVEYELLTPNINASDVEADGRAILLAIAAAVGFPEMILTADYCHDLETDILTDNGFVNPDVARKEGYKLGTVNQETGKLEYQEPQDWVFSDYDGKMYLYERNRLNFCVSRNHHMWLRSENFHKLPTFRQDKSINDFMKCTLGSTSNNKGWRTKVCSMRNFVEPIDNKLSFPNILIKRYPYKAQVEHNIKDTIRDEDRYFDIEDMIEFIGWFVSEGHVDKESGFISLCQSFVNEDNLKEIDILLQKMSVDFKVEDTEPNSLGNVARYWKTNDKALAGWLRVNCGAGSRNKKLPDFVWNLPIELKEKLLATLIKGDGSVSKKGTNKRYYSTSKKLINQVQKLAFELGYHVTSNMKDEGISYVNMSFGHNCMVWRDHIKEIEYKGKVWCAIVPNGLLVTRRNGKVLVSGNSNANYSSSLIAQNPFVREIEDWQDFFSTFYRNLFAVVIQASIDSGELPKNTSIKSRVEFPPMILADLEKIAKAFEILFKFKAISKKTWQHKMGLDHDIEKNNMDADDSDDVFGPPGTPGGASPFNLPTAPINQFGAQMLLCLKEQDWDKMQEIVEEMEEQYPEYFTEDE